MVEIENKYKIERIKKSSRFYETIRKIEKVY
jgi:hypothetical protein